MKLSQKITPHLWFDTNAEEAANFYVSIFKDSGIDLITHFGNEGFEIHHMPEGTVMNVVFRLNGQQFMAINGGPIFKFNEAVSFLIHCENQEEIDYYWEKLNEGGDPKSQQCGWLKDRFGLSWQVAPAQMQDWTSSDNKKKSEAVMREMLKMKKIDIATLEKAFDEA